MGLQSVNIDTVLLAGGLDQTTSALSLPAGYARQSLNFECAVAGGYTRIAGYERVDGRPSPADTAASGAFRYVVVNAYTHVPTVGETLTSSGGGTGVIAFMFDMTIVLCKVAGSWAAGQTTTVGADAVGMLNSVNGGPTSTEQAYQAMNAVADIFRADIAAVPGSGPIRGVVELNDVVYAFRNNAAATGLDVYKTTSTGWSKASYAKKVSFTAGGVTVPADGNTLTEGGVTATILRVVLTSGSWKAGTAAGELIISTPAGGNFSAGAATAGTASITLSGAQTDVAMLPGGSFEFITSNFAGQSTTTRIYGCDGVNPAFEFDGTTLVPITTGAATDTPSRICAHKNHLFLAIKSSVIHSAPGLPYDFTAISGASEMATGDDVTNIISLPGGTGSATLGIFSRNNTSILYGTGTADWNLVAYNAGTGSAPSTVQNMAQTYAFDFGGVNSVQAALEYGNFTQTSLTSAILPFIADRMGKSSASTLCRRKSQYRLFFNDGYGLFITIVNGKLKGCSPVYFPNPIVCAYEGKTADGSDIMYFGSTDGMVYQMEKGTSFDGAVIPYYFSTNFATAKSPRTLKRYRKIVPELSAEGTAFAKFDLSTVLGYGSSNYDQNPIVQYSQLTGGATWDSSLSWDSGLTWDASSISMLECLVEGTAESIAVLINGSSDYIPTFTVNSFLIHYTPRRTMR